MGKKDSVSGSLKAIANAAKSKGLQKLRWYCQVCAKQCRDENGFKCHCTSEAHLRQMEIFGMNQGKFVAEYSREFQRDFLNLLAISHRNSRVAATVIYNEYISNKTHVHMNSTRWTSLTGFIQHLGREGICEIDETPKGWFLIYRPEDKEEKMRQAMKAKRERAEEEDAEHRAQLEQDALVQAQHNLARVEFRGCDRDGRRLLLSAPRAGTLEWTALSDDERIPPSLAALCDEYAGGGDAVGGEGARAAALAAYVAGELPLRQWMLTASSC